MIMTGKEIRDVRFHVAENEFFDELYRLFDLDPEFIVEGEQAFYLVDEGVSHSDIYKKPLNLKPEQIVALKSIKELEECRKKIKLLYP